AGRGRHSIRGMPFMTPNHEVGLYIFILAGFLGYHVISRVPPLLHTPLMSATNAISGISLIGSMVVTCGFYHPLDTVLGLIAVACSSTNVVGGFLITDRMLKMFKSERDSSAPRQGPVILAGLVIVTGLVALLVWFQHQARIPGAEILRYLYILSAVLFI